MPSSSSSSASAPFHARLAHTTHHQTHPFLHHSSGQLSLDTLAEAATESGLALGRQSGGKAYSSLATRPLHHRIILPKMPPICSRSPSHASLLSPLHSPPPNSFKNTTGAMYAKLHSCLYLPPSQKISKRIVIKKSIEQLEFLQGQLAYLSAQRAHLLQTKTKPGK